ncbi:hypothetical protein [Haloplanus natans]|uniref:hypothetical protein n=1 Tax=Haloplanus natans TaxID=376171 RepID=UPI0012F751EA|nr:hypothetical protein [Haloplanus natans]
MFAKDLISGDLGDDSPPLPPEPETVESDEKTCTDLSNCDTNNATIINWQETPTVDGEYWDSPSDWRYSHKESTYKHLDRVNGGLQNGGKWQNRRYETFHLNETQMRMVADRVELNKGQQNRAVRIFTALNLSKFGRNKEWVALAVCGYVLFKDGRRKCHPNNRGEGRDEAYREACVSYNCTDKTVNKFFYQVQRIVENESPNKSKNYKMSKFESEVADHARENLVAEQGPPAY